MLVTYSKWLRMLVMLRTRKVRTCIYGETQNYVMWVVYTMSRLEHEWLMSTPGSA